MHLSVDLFINAVFLVLILIAIILAVSGSCITTNNINILHWKYAPVPSFSFSINTDINDDIVESYAGIWGYNLGDISSEYILYLNDSPGNMDINRNFGHIISMAGISEYILFDNSSSFISRNRSVRCIDDIRSLVKSECTLSDLVLKDVLDSGFPYRTQHGIILHRAYLDNIINSSPLPFEDITIIPSYIEARTPSKLAVSNKIPKIIHQTFETRALPLRLAEAVNTWLKNNPDYEYRYYDNGDRRSFIERNFDNSVLKAYDKLIPGAYKADLWRYCVIYIVGGVYIDIKMGDIVALGNIIDNDTSMVFVNDGPDNAIYNAFFASFPRNPLLYNVIMSVVSNIEANYYGDSPLYPTGPIAMGVSILPELHYDKHLPPGKTLTPYGYMQVYTFKHIEGGGRIGVNDGPILILTRNTPNTHDQPYLQRITGNPNYGILWRDLQIYL